MLQAYNYLIEARTRHKVVLSELCARMSVGAKKLPEHTQSLWERKQKVLMAYTEYADALLAEDYPEIESAVNVAYSELEQMAVARGYEIDENDRVMAYTPDAAAELQPNGDWYARYDDGRAVAIGKTAEEAFAKLKRDEDAATAAQGDYNPHGAAAEVCGFLVALGMIAALGVCVSIIWRAYQVAP